jgi:hypothetical protein
MHRVVAGAAAACLAVAFAGCGLLPDAGISRDQAVAVAFDHSALTHGVLLSVVEGKWPMGREPRRAWIVTLRGSYLACEDADGRRSSETERCQVVDGEATIYVAIDTGDFLGGDVGGPIDVPEGP